LKVVWSARANRDLAAIVDYIARDNPSAAERVGLRIGDAAASLTTMPRRGRPSRLKAGRELVLAPLPYIIEYAVADEEVLILHIRHGAQDVR
jgi:plasmid stabilization system protein ParE